MTYLVLSAVFLGVAVVALLLLRPRGATRWQALAVTGVVLCVLTAVFDNIMIAAQLFHYSPEHLSGVRVVLAPIEDFAYPIAGTLLLPPLWWALRRRRASGEGERP